MEYNRNIGGSYGGGIALFLLEMHHFILGNHVLQLGKQSVRLS